MELLYISIALLMTGEALALLGLEIVLTEIAKRTSGA